ncbi:MAG TPA: sigma-70 family RNA polymerase sigma factor [Vicinamibacteria bacterium]|nr:sigma-70 family RNA polymerase sigma factor [Vicinamibacteria bacterium]
MGSVAPAADFVGHTLRVTAERFCELYAPAVCRFAAMAARSPAEADDIAQEALLRAVRRLDRFDPLRGEVEAWLWRIVANVASDMQRAERRRLALWTRLSRVREVTIESVESLAIDHIDNQRLLASLRLLGPRDRTLLALRFGADLDLSAVGEALGMSEATAGRAVLRALEKLRSSLEVNP